MKVAAEGAICVVLTEKMLLALQPLVHKPLIPASCCFIALHDELLDSSVSGRDPGGAER